MTTTTLQSTTEETVLTNQTFTAKVEIHGPAAVHRPKGRLAVLSIDRVPCVCCLMWPSQAADWPTQHRNYNWPDSATLERVVCNGCDVVPVAHRQCRQDERMARRQWRLVILTSRNCTNK